MLKPNVRRLSAPPFHHNTNQCNLLAKFFFIAETPQPRLIVLSNRATSELTKNFRYRERNKNNRSTTQITIFLFQRTGKAFRQFIRRGIPCPALWHSRCCIFALRKLRAKSTAPVMLLVYRDATTSRNIFGRPARQCFYANGDGLRNWRILPCANNQSAAACRVIER